MAPTHLTAGSRTSRNGKNANESLSVTSQVWQKSGKCGKGTIPVRRIRKRELLKAHSIEEYGRKKPSFSHHQHAELNKNLDSFVQLKNHSVSFVILIALYIQYHNHKFYVISKIVVESPYRPEKDI